jgi:uncharacterized protein (DUF1800 family)
MPRLPVLSGRKWTRSSAAHLARRVGFGPSPEQIDHLAALSPEDAVNEVLQPAASAVREKTPAWFQDPAALYRFPGGRTWREMRELPKEERREIGRAFGKENRKQMQECRGWWLDRMAATSTPLEEKQTLFWHGHFATAFRKVRNPTPMMEQNMMFRENAKASWPDLLEAVSADPAMLTYLDNFRSNRRKPNENYARELMELFSLGESYYTEEDVRNAARAFTGWTLKRDSWEFTFNPRQHDSDPKTFMGDTGPFNGRDIIDRITARPRAAEFLAERLWTFYASDTPNPHAVRDVASRFRESGLYPTEALRALFLHEEFYHPSVIRGKVKSPVELTVGLVRTLQIRQPAGHHLARACRQLGQDLFDPPSVKGWDGGSAWITASSLALRYHISERLIRQKNAFAMEDLLPDRQISREEVRDRLFDLFHASRLRQEDRIRFDHVLASLPPPSDWSRNHLLTALNHLVQHPQYQLC